MHTVGPSHVLAHYRSLVPVDRGEGRLSKWKAGLRSSHMGVVCRRGESTFGVKDLVGVTGVGGAR